MFHVKHSLFANAEDPDYKRDALHQFEMIQLQNGESVFDFSKRFGLLYRAVVGSGQSVSERDRINIYLRALRENTEPRILYEVKDVLRDHESEVKQVLANLQRRLIKEEELISNTFSGKFRDQ